LRKKRGRREGNDTRKKLICRRKEEYRQKERERERGRERERERDRKGTMKARIKSEMGILAQ